MKSYHSSSFSDIIDNVSLRPYRGRRISHSTRLFTEPSKMPLMRYLRLATKSCGSRTSTSVALTLGSGFRTSSSNWRILQGKTLQPFLVSHWSRLLRRECTHSQPSHGLCLGTWQSRGIIWMTWMPRVLTSPRRGIGRGLITSWMQLWHQELTRLLCPMKRAA